MLNAVRHGAVTAEIAGRLNEMGARPQPTDGAITLATTNGIVNRINAHASSLKLPGPCSSPPAPRSTGSSGGVARIPADARTRAEGGRAGR